ncbi:hypothetical protein [Microbacterium sp. LWO13-1.2]|uniref:hypothetical protein n=1 Tax=Microbacterium sp. LWO13-1.2 TaxID=3135262 RepID=UPI003138A441
MVQVQTASGDRVIRIVGGVLAAGFGVPFLLLGGTALSSRFGWGAGDPHGYAMIFGTVLALGLGLLTAVVVPLIFRFSLRGAAYTWSMLVYVLVAVGLIAALLTA